MPLWKYIKFIYFKTAFCIIINYLNATRKRKIRFYWKNFQRNIYISITTIRILQLLDDVNTGRMVRGQPCPYSGPVKQRAIRQRGQGNKGRALCARVVPLLYVHIRAWWTRAAFSHCHGRFKEAVKVGRPHDEHSIEWGCPREHRLRAT